MNRVCLLILATLYFIPYSQAEEIRLSNGEWKPYLSEGAPHFGYVSHIVTEAFEAVGVTVKYDFYPWARAELLVEKGAIDGSVVWSSTPKRENFAYFSEPVIADDEVLFHLKSNPMEWTSFQDLRGVTIGVPLGSTLGVWEEPIERGLVNLRWTQTIEKGFSLLLLNRIGAFPLNKSVGYHLVRTLLPLDVDRITHAEKLVDRHFYRLMLSKKIKRNVELMDRFNKGLELLRESGRLAVLEEDFYSGKYD